ncbi:Clavaminate synthase-like protein [Amylostereum chailletii]|nr:Clavaminate synthase-like protein [Amylostereum chailletii]
MPSASIPAFPEDVPTVPLLVIDYERIKANDEAEIDRLWKASTELGFWYLKNHGADEEVASMFELGAETMQLPLAEKIKFEQGNDGNSFGYKAAGANATDETGALDRVEFINVSKDDALSYPTPVHRTYPSTVTSKMETVVTPFVRKAIDVNGTIINVFNKRLGLPEGTLANLHQIDKPSGSEARCIKTPKDRRTSPDKAMLGAHTDFGSLSFLHHNRLGGLQVMLPGTEDWKYVKPIPGHAICNIGDTLTVFSGGILRSNLHRIVYVVFLSRYRHPGAHLTFLSRPPPKAQSAFERWSVVFFTRPDFTKNLAPLTKESAIIAEAVSRAPEGKFDTGAIAGQWYTRRMKYQRIANRTVSLYSRIRR